MPSTAIIDVQSSQIAESSNSILISEAPAQNTIAAVVAQTEIYSPESGAITSHKQEQVIVSAQEKVMVLDRPSLDIAIGKLSGDLREVRFDFVGSFTFVGVALTSGILETVKAWRVRRIDNSNAPSVKSAGGQDRFSFAWADRLVLTYL